MASLLPQFIKLNQKYNLVADEHKVLIAVSGGVDSLVLCRLLTELRRAEFKRLDLQAAYVRIAPVALPAESIIRISEELARWEIPFTILEGELVSVNEFDCYACARERRRQLFKFTADNGFGGLAFGHNLDDYLETGLLNLLFNGSLESLRPVQNQCDDQIRIIRPLLGISKKHIKAGGRADKIEPAAGFCKLASANKRENVRQMIRYFSRINRKFRSNLRGAINHWNQLEI